MDVFIEKRSAERFTLEAPAQFVANDARHPLQAKIVNCSEDGLCFDTDSALPPGSTVFVAAKGDNKFFRAEVKWCRRQAGTAGVYFRIGARYIDQPLPG